MNCLCRERQARNRKVCSNLWSYSGHKEIPTKVPKPNQKYRVSMGKRSQKVHTEAEEEGRSQRAFNNWKS